jgi:uncharacterized protein (TIGR02001 family)
MLNLASAARAQEAQTAAPPAAPAVPEIGMLVVQPMVTSDYRYQGISSSDGHPTAQLSLYLWRPDNWYAGVFLTGVDYNDGDTSLEVDTYAGRHFRVRGTRLTLEAMYTSFPDRSFQGPTYDFWQFKAQAQRSFGRLQLTGVASYVPQASYGSGQATRLETEAVYRLTPSLTARAQVGRRWIERGYDRTYWSLGAAAKWRQLTLDVRYVDTDLPPQACTFTTCEPAVVATLTYDLPHIPLGRRR